MQPWEQRSAEEQERIRRLPIPSLLHGRLEQASDYAWAQAERDGRAVFWLQVIAAEVGFLVLGLAVYFVLEVMR